MTNSLLSKSDNPSNLEGIKQTIVDRVAEQIHNAYMDSVRANAENETQNPQRRFLEDNGVLVPVNYKEVKDPEWLRQQDLSMVVKVDSLESEAKPPQGIVEFQGKYYSDILRPFSDLPRNHKDLNTGAAKFLVPLLIDDAISVHNNWCIENAWQLDGKIGGFSRDEFYELSTPLEQINYIYSLTVADYEAGTLPENLTIFLPFTELTGVEAAKDLLNIRESLTVFYDILDPAEALKKLYQAEQERWILSEGVDLLKANFPDLVKSNEAPIFARFLVGSTSASEPFNVELPLENIENIYAVAKMLTQNPDLTEAQKDILSKLVPFEQLSEANQAKVRETVNTTVDSTIKLATERRTVNQTSLALA